MPFAPENTVAITMPQMDVSCTSFASETKALPTDDSELYSPAHYNEPKSHLQSPDERKSSFDLKRFNNALHTDALLAICSSLRDLGTQRAVRLRIPNRPCKIVKGYHVKCPMPVFFSSA